jgi:hypothetical protein
MRNGPDSASVIGNYDTSDTAGGDAPHTTIEGVAPVFEVARGQDLVFALRAMDTRDSAIPPNLVQTSPGLTVNRGDPAADEQRIKTAAAESHEHLRELGYDIDPVRGVVPKDSAVARQWMAEPGLGHTIFEEDPERG